MENAGAAVVGNAAGVAAAIAVHKAGHFFGAGRAGAAAILVGLIAVQIGIGAGGQLTGAAAADTERTSAASDAAGNRADAGVRSSMLTPRKYCRQDVLVSAVKTRRERFARAAKTR